MAKILIVEDDRAINDLIYRNLKLVGHDCTCVFNGLEALTNIKENVYDLILLDIMLPGIDGFEIIEKIRGVPVIFVTAKNNLQDRLKGLTSGAEDYIVKPFEILELIARANIVLKRNMKSNILHINETKIDLNGHRVFFQGKEVELAPKEYVLLETLVVNRNLALSREKLLELAWGYEYEGDTRTVDVHIQKLRRKLGLEDNIKTVYKLGYRLET